MHGCTHTDGAVLVVLRMRPIERQVVSQPFLMTSAAFIGIDNYNEINGGIPTPSLGRLESESQQ